MERGGEERREKEREREPLNKYKICHILQSQNRNPFETNFR